MKNEDPDRRPIESIDSKHMMSTILFLHENGPSRRMDIYQHVCRNANMPAKIRQMIDCGIMTENILGNIITFELTESGRKIAEHLQDIEELISPTCTGYDDGRLPQRPLNV